MGRPRKTTVEQKQIIGIIDLYKRFMKGESSTSLAEELAMDVLILNKWLKDMKTVDNLLKTEEEHDLEVETWKNMYLKVAYRLEQLENQKSDS